MKQDNVHELEIEEASEHAITLSHDEQTELTATPYDELYADMEDYFYQVEDTEHAKSYDKRNQRRMMMKSRST